MKTSDLIKEWYDINDIDGYDGFINPNLLSMVNYCLKRIREQEKK